MHGPQIGRNAPLAQLMSASPSALRRMYAEYLGRPPPPKASVDLVRSNIAWSIQARSAGKDPEGLRVALLAAQRRTGSSSRRTPYKPGTRLVREWQGKVHEVTVLEQGYRWRGLTYRSLSRIAEEITGAHWSGPRFFGMTKAKR